MRIQFKADETPDWLIKSDNLANILRREGERKDKKPKLAVSIPLSEEGLRLTNFMKNLISDIYEDSWDVPKGEIKVEKELGTIRISKTTVVSLADKIVINQNGEKKILNIEQCLEDHLKYNIDKDIIRYMLKHPEIKELNNLYDTKLSDGRKLNKRSIEYLIKIKALQVNEQTVKKIPLIVNIIAPTGDVVVLSEDGIRYFSKGNFNLTFRINYCLDALSDDSDRIIMSDEKEALRIRKLYAEHSKRALEEKLLETPLFIEKKTEHDFTGDNLLEALKKAMTCVEKGNYNEAEEHYNEAEELFKEYKGKNKRIATDRRIAALKINNLELTKILNKEEKKNEKDRDQKFLEVYNSFNEVYVKLLEGKIREPEAFKEAYEITKKYQTSFKDKREKLELIDSIPLKIIDSYRKKKKPVS